MGPPGVGNGPMLPLLDGLDGGDLAGENGPVSGGAESDGLAGVEEFAVDSAGGVQEDGEIEGPIHWQ